MNVLAKELLGTVGFCQLCQPIDNNDRVTMLKWTEKENIAVQHVLGQGMSQAIGLWYHLKRQKCFDGTVITLFSHLGGFFAERQEGESRKDRLKKFGMLVFFAICTT
jgi:hypothetical protein